MKTIRLITLITLVSMPCLISAKHEAMHPEHKHKNMETKEDDLGKTFWTVTNDTNYTIKVKARGFEDEDAVMIPAGETAQIDRTHSHFFEVMIPDKKITLREYSSQHFLHVQPKGETFEVMKSNEQ